MRNLTAFLLLLVLGGGASAQMSLNEIEFYRIPQKKIKKFIHDQVNNQVVFFNELIPSCPVTKDISDFSEHVKEYTVNSNIETVWQNYLVANPSYVWESNIVSFGCLVDKYQNEVVYRNEEYKGIDTGQVYYLNLRIMQGIYNLAVAFEVVDINEKNHTLEFSYIEGGKANGKQQLRFVAIDENHTKIIHKSRFKSNSNVRDKILYPFFHERSIDQFHENMSKLIDENTSENSHLLSDSRSN